MTPIVKYSNLTAFHKHLASAAPTHLCRLYLVAISDDFERGQVLDAIVRHLPEKPVRFHAEECEIKEVIDAMQSFSLFGDSIVLVDEADKFLKKAQLQLVEEMKRASGTVLIGLGGKAAPLMDAAEKEGVVLDLLGEKAWERDKRLVEQMVAQARDTGKVLSQGTAQLILDRVGSDAARLHSEVDKLGCYIGERKEIAAEDVLQMTAESSKGSVWQTAEEIVWEQGASFDPADFHSLLPAIRSQLHLGLTLATMIEEGRSSSEWSAYLPKLWPKVLEKRSAQAARKGSEWFRKAIRHLFDMELASRSNSTQYGALIDLFRGRIC